MIPLNTIAACFTASFLILGSGAFATTIVWIKLSWVGCKRFHTISYIFEQRFLFETLIFRMCPPITCCLVAFLHQSRFSGSSKHRRICIAVSDLRNSMVSFLSTDLIFLFFTITPSSPKLVNLQWCTYDNFEIRRKTILKYYNRYVTYVSQKIFYVERPRTSW